MVLQLILTDIVEPILIITIKLRFSYDHQIQLGVAYGLQLPILGCYSKMHIPFRQYYLIGKEIKIVVRITPYIKLKLLLNFLNQICITRINLRNVTTIQRSTTISFIIINLYESTIGLSPLWVRVTFVAKNVQFRYLSSELAEGRWLYSGARSVIETS